MCLPWTAICLPCSLTTVTFSISGSSFASNRFTDLTARLTNTAIETIAIAMMINDRAITTITQNMGSWVLN